MFTIFVTFRPFDHPHFGMIQRNAIGSWLQLNPRPEVLVMGNEAGAAEICTEYGLRHVPDVALSPQGTPMLDDMFLRAEQMASHDLLVLIAADIILFQETIEAAAIMKSRFSNFMAILRRRDKQVDNPIDFTNPNWSEEVKQGATLGHPGAGDFFLFNKGFFGNGIPPFTIGRASADNWLIYEAVRLGVCCDLTDAIQIIHQKHDYSHIDGGFQGLVGGEEFKINRALGAGKMLEIINSNWVMGADKVPRKR